MIARLVLRKHPFRYTNFCLFRIYFGRGMDSRGVGYSAKLSFGLRPRALEIQREWDGWIVTVLGLRIHYKRRSK